MVLLEVGLWLLLMLAAFSVGYSLGAPHGSLAINLKSLLSRA